MINLLKKIFAFVFLITITFTSLTCKKSPVEPNGTNKFTFTFEDASCTEVWFNLKLNNLPKPVLVNVYRDNFLDKSFNIYTTDDTTFYIENLLPKRNYEVYVEVQPKNERVYRSSILRFTTMDTTSHDFTWQVFEFGECSNSVLYDVAIIDENDIWAVGEIYMRDSLGRCDPNAYNAVHWNGSEWKLKKIGGQGGWACHTIYAFSANDIWFEGNIHWNGTTYKAYMNGWPLMPNGDGWRVNKMWGSSSSDLYAVGNDGNIAHWDGVKWRKIESGTRTDINDIWGIDNQLLNIYKIYCAVSYVFQIGDYKILTIDKNKKVDSISCNTGRRVHSVWSKKGFPIYTSGGGIFENKKGYWKEVTEVPLIYTNRIRGNDLNDIFAVGDFGLFAHFNGFSWKVESSLYIDGIYFSVASLKNTVVVVGIKGRKAVVVIGKR